MSAPISKIIESETKQLTSEQANNIRRINIELQRANRALSRRLMTVNKELNDLTKQYTSLLETLQDVISPEVINMKKRKKPDVSMLASTDHPEIELVPFTLSEFQVNYIEIMKNGHIVMSQAN